MKNNKIVNSFLIAVVCVLAACTKPTQDIVADNFTFAGKQLAYALTEMEFEVKNESESSIRQRSNSGWSELVNPRSLKPDGSLMIDRKSVV